MMSPHENELEMFTFFEKTPVLVCIAGKDGYFRKVNPAVVSKLGYSIEELFAKPISSFIYHEDKVLTEQERAKLLEGKALINFQNRYVTKEGSIIWLEWNSIYFPEKEVVFAIAKDITERKLVEIEIEEKYRKFRSLAKHFKKTIEEERKYLALELHEELAQLAAVVRMDIDHITDELPTISPEAKNRIDHAIGVTELLINTIRRISFAMSPQMLDEHGLDETLKWHCKEFSLLNGIPCRFKSDYDETVLTKEIKLDFFRICQEALGNVMYHAQAASVEVSIEDIGNSIRLAISDDGKGFDKFKHRQTAGISSMRERAASINGELNILSEPGKGTTVSIEIEKHLNSFASQKN